MQPRERLLCFLHSLGGHANRQNCLSTGFSPTALLNNNQICINILSEQFVPRMIKWPTRDQMNEEASLFVKAYGGPKTMFIVADGTHIEGLFYVTFLVLKLG